MTIAGIFKKTSKWLLIFFLGLLGITCLLLIFIHLPTGKRFVKNEVQQYLSNKLQTKVVIGALDYRIPDWVTIKKLYIEDQHKDTLLYVDYVRIDIKMLRLLNNNIHINKVAVSNAWVNINRPITDSTFNYNFIVTAFTNNNNETTSNDTSSIKFSLQQLSLKNTHLHFNDRYGGNVFNTSLDSLFSTFKEIKTGKPLIDIHELYINGLKHDMTMISGAESENNAENISSSSASLLVKAGKVTLENAAVNIIDSVSGMYSANNLNDVSITNALFNLSRNQVSAGTVSLTSSQIVFSSPVLNKNVSPGNNWDIKANKVIVNNSRVIFDNPPAAPQPEGIDFSHLDLSSISADIDSMHNYGTHFKGKINNLSFKEKSGLVIEKAKANLVFNDTTLLLQGLYVQTPKSVLQHSFSLRFDSLSGIMQNPRRTFVAANFNNSKLSVEDLYLLMPSLKEGFPPASFSNQSIEFDATIQGSLAKLTLPHIRMNALSGSKIKGSGVLYNLIHPDLFSYNFDIKFGNLPKQDIMRFIPSEHIEQVRSLPSLVNIAGNISGNTSEVKSEAHLFGKGFDFEGSVLLKTPNENRAPTFTVKLKKGEFDKNFITNLIPENTLPPGFSIPKYISVSGDVNGAEENISANAHFTTEYGDANIKGFIDKYTDAQDATYDVDIYLNRFDLGKLTGKDSLLGLATGRLLAKGTGYDYKTMVTAFSVDMSQLYLNDYIYHNIITNGNLNKGEFRTHLSVSDSAVALNGILEGDISGSYPVFKGNMQVDTLRLEPLHLHPDEMDMAFSVALEVQNLTPHDLNFKIKVDTISFVMHNERFPIDSIVIRANAVNGMDSITLNSGIAHAYLAGSFDYNTVTNALIKYINRFYKINADSIPQQPMQQVSFGLETSDNHPIFSAIVPGLNKISGVKCSGSFVSDENGGTLLVNGSLDTLVYKGIIAGKTDVDIRSAGDSILYNLDVRSVKVAGKTFLKNTIFGHVMNDSLLVNFLTKDAKDRDWFALNGIISNKDSGYWFHVGEKMLLNYASWTTTPDNYVHYGKSGLLVNNFKIQNEASRIFISSQEDKANSPVDLSLDNFNLFSISSFFSSDKEIMNGSMNARLTIDDLNKDVPSFTGYAYISHFELMTQPIGDVEFYAANIDDDVVSARMYVTGNENNIEMSADYNLLTNNIKADIDILKMNAATLKAFSSGRLKHADGNIHGKASLTGDITNPIWNGRLLFDTVYFALTDLGAPYRVNNQFIDLNYPLIQFKEFTIKDSLNNSMYINGNIRAKSISKYDLNFNVKTNDFVVLNVEQNPENEFFGYASVDANLWVRGTSEEPDIQGNILLNDKSDVTIILPEQNFDKDAAKSIVRFVDADTLDIIKSREKFKDGFDQGDAFVKFLNYNLNIEVKKDATLRILVDPVSGDEMTVRGNAQLNAGVDPGGNLLLAGNYELESGSYVLNYQFLQRRFNLLKGSTIAFLGAPMNARVDVNAEYISKASPRDLLSGEVGSADASLLNSFSQKIPFKVVMNMTGELKKPVIKFDIQLPEENTGARISPDLRTLLESKLAQIRGDEATINKQVFSLLLFNRFISEKSSDFFKGSGTEFNDIARQSVSQFLSSALNEIAGELISGVDIDLNVNSYTDYTSTGNTNRTDLNLSLSKAFLDNRLVVTMGKNFGIEGQNQTTKAEGFNSYMPDVTVAYKLSRDGRYMVRAYRKNEFEVILDGYMVETGVGFVMTIEYDRFKEIIKKRKRLK